MKALVQDADLFGNPIEKQSVSPLSDKFLAPPFSVLDARQGYWKDRKAEWASLGVAGEEGRIANLAELEKVCNAPGGYNGQKRSNLARSNGQDLMKGENPNFAKHKGVLHTGNGGYDWDEEYEGGSAWRGAGSSIFDPVLCEIVYRWFAPEGGKVLDPFAGGSTRGIVAEYLGYKYTGIELRAEQIEANQKQAEKIACAPVWINGDSSQLANLVLLPEKYEEKYDLVFTCPPYFNLERYSDGDSDGSAFETYEKFMWWYEDIFKQAIALLKWNRFLVVVVGEIRCDKGFYRNFVGDNISCFLRLGLRYYNEAILLTSIGSLPLRIGKQFGGYRKLGKTHQNVLVFYNGSNHDQIKEKFGKTFVGKSEEQPEIGVREGIREQVPDLPEPEPLIEEGEPEDYSAQASLF